MSNHKFGENPNGRKPKVSVAMEVNHGLGGPKVISVFGQGQPMESRLIFRPLNVFRWGDGA